jgi:biopolymer transport protein ExbB/TolQ
MSNQTTVVKQVKTEVDSVNTPIVEQFNKLKQVFLVNDTATTFSKTVQLLFALGKEAMVLIWLVICWGIVALSLVSEKVKQLSQRLTIRWNEFQDLRQHQSMADIAPKTAQSIFSTGEQTVQNLVAEAKKQVGFQNRQ